MLTLAALVGVIVLGCVAFAAIGARDRSLLPVESRQVSARLLAALVAFVVVLGVGVALVAAAPQLLGLPLVVAPGIGVAVAFILFGTPWRSRRFGSIRTAALLPRAAWTGSIAWAYGPPIAAASALIALLCATAATASSDELGRSRMLIVVRHDSTTTASPYPGWFYAAPIMLVTLGILLAAVMAIRRTALLPALTADPVDDTAWRRCVASVLSRIATAGLLLYLTAALLMVAGALRSISQTSGDWWAFGAGTALILGISAAVTAGVALLTAIRRATAVRISADMSA